MYVNNLHINIKRINKSDSQNGPKEWMSILSKWVMRKAPQRWTWWVEAFFRCNWRKTLPLSLGENLVVGNPTPPFVGVCFFVFFFFYSESLFPWPTEERISKRKSEYQKRKKIGPGKKQLVVLMQILLICSYRIAQQRNM